jgi:hypothetical protein
VVTPTFSTFPFLDQSKPYETKNKVFAMGMNRRLKRKGTFDANSDMQFLFVQHHALYPLKMSRLNRRTEREGRAIRFHRMVGKIVLLSFCYGGILIVSAKAAVAYVPNNGINSHTHTIRRNKPGYTRSVVSSSKIVHDRTNQMNATNDNSDIDDHLESIVQQSLNSNKITYSPIENVFHKDGKSDGRRSGDLHNLKRLLIESNEEKNAVQHLESMSMKIESGEEIQNFSIERANGSLQEMFGSVEFEMNGREQIQPQFVSEKAKHLQFDKNDTIISNSRSSIFRRIRPLKRIKNIFKGTSTITKDNAQMNNITNFGIDTGMNISDDNNKDYSDDSLENEKSSLRKLWRRRHARTLEEGIRRERRKPSTNWV